MEWLILGWPLWVAIYHKEYLRLVKRRPIGGTNVPMPFTFPEWAEDMEIRRRTVKILAGTEDTNDHTPTQMLGVA